MKTFDQYEKLFNERNTPTEVKKSGFELLSLLRKIKKEVDNVEGSARDTICEIKEMLEHLE